MFTKELKTSHQDYNLDIGNYKQFLVGHSADEFIRLKSASGGIATSLLIYALDKKIVDKVVVVVNGNDIAKPGVKITDLKEDVLLSMQSKYVQAPLNNAIKEMRESDCRYGMVGLPCHIQGLYLAERIYKGLSERMIFKIGLFCGYSYSYECIDTLLKKMKVKREDVKTFLGWREGDCYPGFFSIKLRSGETVSMSFIEEHNIDVAHFALFRCFLCIDGLNQLADISLGDTPDMVRNNNFIISRTDRGNQLLESARSDKYIDYHAHDAETALTMGIIPFMLREKRYKVLSVIQNLAKRNVPVPDWDIKEAKIKISKLDRINGVLRIKMVIFIRRSLIGKLLKSHPKLMEIAGSFIYHFDIDPKHLAFRTIYKFLKSHPKLMEAARAIYHYDVNPKHIASKTLQRIREILLSKSGKLTKRDRNRIPVGLVGIGVWGRQYVDILRKSDIFDLRVCFDTNEEILEGVCSSVGCLKANSLEELIVVDGLQAVVIVTPNHLHYEQCTKAIKQGKHVFVEKPIANTIEEAKKIYQAAKKNNLIVSVGHNVRRRSEFRMMKKLIESKEIGKVLMVEANNSQNMGIKKGTPWRLKRDDSPGGPLLQLGIHNIDALQYLFGDIKEVKAYLTNRYLDAVIDDTGTIICAFESGILGYIGATYSESPRFTMTVFGTKGNLVLQDNELYLYIGKKRKKLKIMQVDTLKEQVAEFGECILNNRKPEVGVEEAMRALAVVEAAIESSHAKGGPITVGNF